MGTSLVIRACPHHGNKGWLIIQGFYRGLANMARSHQDVAARGAFFSLTVKDARDLIKKMVTNQGWNDERIQPKKRGVHTIHEVDILSAKMDLVDVGGCLNHTLVGDSTPKRLQTT